jgi:predicted phage terminase large subunit-like protein
MPGGSIVVLMTRWSSLDLTGMLVNHMAKNPDADQWEVVEFPAILHEGTPEEKSLWPEFWPLDELKKKKAGMDPRYWQAQYMQSPTGEEGALIKRDWWRHWEHDDPPEIDYLIMSLDAAQEAHNRADYNAMTVWGVFEKDNEYGVKTNNIILLDAWRERLEFPDLKKRAFEYYKEWEPDTFIVEKKSNGAALYQEMRAAGIPVTEFTPSKGNDKISRVNAVSDMFSSGIVWAPKDRRWAMEVINEAAEFPAGQNDDYVDSLTQALIRMRKGGFIRLPMDEEDDDMPYKLKRSTRYY